MADAISFIGRESLESHMRSAGLKVTAGQEVRLLDVRADTGKHGVFEDLHGYADGASFALAIKEACRMNHGSVGLDYLTRLGLDIEVQALAHKSFRNRFFTKYVPNDASGQVKRVAQRFAFISYAGELATSYGLTGWSEGEALESAGILFKEWLDERGGTTDQEQTKLIAQTRLFFEQHGDSRFQRFEGEERVIANRAGFKKSLMILQLSITFWLRASDKRSPKVSIKVGQFPL